MAAAELLLSGFADEAAVDRTIEQQFSAFAAMGLRYLSLRFVDVGRGIRNAMDLTDEELIAVRSRLETYGLEVSSLGSPIGKVKLLDVEDGTANRFVPFPDYLSEVERACEIAQRLGTRLIRGFSFYPPAGTDPEPHLSQCVDQLGQIAQRCGEQGLVFGLEVEANLVGQNGHLLAEIHRQIGQDSLVLIFDGGNLVTQGYQPGEILEQFRAMLPGLGWIHIKDFKRPPDWQRQAYIDEEALRHFVPADRGDTGHAQILAELAGELPRLQQAMQQRGVPGVFADLEPHLKGGGQFGGYSGPDGFGVALRSLRGLCDQAGIVTRLRDFDDVRASRGY